MKGLFAKTSLTLILLTFAAGLSGQAIKDIRINEMLVNNIDSYQDDYGHREGWIELFNSGYSMVDIGGAYLKVRGKEYRIPKNDKRTQIAPQGYIIFFAEGTASKGTFHTNFRLEESDYIAFYDQSGRGPAIDSVAYDPNTMKPDISVGWYEDEKGVMRFGELNAVTPMATNETLEKIPRAEHFRRADPAGVVMTITAVAVVFTALILLYLIFKQVGNAFIRSATPKKKRKAESAPGSVAVAAEGDMNGEVLAAISLAIYKYSEELHDIENTVLTINRAAKAYSPWSSKIYGLRINPLKK